VKTVVFITQEEVFDWALFGTFELRKHDGTSSRRKRIPYTCSHLILRQWYLCCFSLWIGAVTSGVCYPLISLQDIVPSPLGHDTRATDRFSAKPNKVFQMPAVLFCKLQNLCIEPKSDKFATLWSWESGSRYYRAYQHNSTEMPLTTRYTVQEALLFEPR
jgi:hypothetical protein